jgi:WD40 repeat protein
MSEWNDSPSFLLTLAAESVGPAITGCGKVLASESKANGPADRLKVKGINYFGPRIMDAWMSWFETLPAHEQTEALVELAGLPVTDGRREMTEAVERLAPDATAEERRVAIEYLAAIPLSVRRSLVPDPTTGRLTLSPPLTNTNDQGLLRLLPVEAPPYPIQTVLPGTSYELEELLGIGGFGAVYKARNRCEQNLPPRAIKFCLDPAMVASLHRERTILDRLMTAGETAWSNRIVRLYGYALDAQPPFLVYEYVPGGDLTSHLTATRSKTGRGFRPGVVLELIRQVAEALAFAHGQGLVHRDLKPANILVSGTTIKLTDFGIGGVVASHMARGGQVSGTGFTLSTGADQASVFRGSGTPLYMSAEQRRGEQPDPRHDLYSLGVVWYQLLVGDVTRELHPGWPDELIEEFQTPLGHLELIQRCVGYFKKRPADASELLALLPPTPGPNRSQESGVRSQGSGVRSQGSGNKEEVPSASRSSAASNSEASCFREHRGWVRCVAFTPDSACALSGGDDAILRLWDLSNRRPVIELAGHQGAIMSLAIASDGRRVLSGSWDGTVRFWDLYSGQQIRRLEGNWKAIKCVALAPDASRALFAGDDRILYLWDLPRGVELRRFEGHTDTVQCLAITPDGRRAISAGDDRTLRLWDLENGHEMRCLEGHTDTVTSLAIGPNGRWFLSGSSDRTLRLWDLETCRTLRRLEGHGNWINSVAIAPDGRRVLSGSGGEIVDNQFADGADTTVRLWDVVSGKEVCCLEGHTASVTSVAISSDGRCALSGSLDKTVRLWKLPR